MKTIVATALISLTAATPAAAQTATLTVEPEQRCYREQQSVLLPGSGFTPNAQVDFSVDGEPLEVADPITADPAGELTATRLTLREMLGGRRRISYTATDSANAGNVAEVELLVTATAVMLRPPSGPQNRRFRIAARGFFGGRTLYAHIRRNPGRGVRTMRIGTVRGACRIVRARRRLFPAGAPAGRYSIQFDTFRRYRPSREIEFEYNLTVTEPR